MGFGGTRNNDYRDILRQLVGPEGEPGHGWELGSGVPMCEWEGIVCNSKKELIEINLVGKDLSDGGYLPKELGHIQTLEAIRLNATDISGTIPISIAHLPKLKVFSVGDNQLTGVLPPFFVSPTLQTFNVSDNDLVGTISQTFYYATDGHAALQYFDVDSNQLSGTINEAIGMWHQLNTLSMSDNNFTGTIPKTLGVLATKGQLTYLYLDSNNLVGTIPEELAITSEDAADSNKLEDVWLHENLLSGTIPPDFALLTKLKDFYIDGNKLTGIIPPDLCDNTQGINEDFLDLVLDKELKNHQQSSSSNNGNGSSLPVRPENSCDILSCPVNTYSSEGVFPCKPCPTDEIMPWLGGEERCYHQDTLKILKLFYESTNGQHWNIEKNNWFTSDNYCTFEGVRCNNDKHVQELILPNIGLRGQLPPDLGMLEHLHTLDVSDNDLTGGLPAELRLASSLKWLDVSGNQIRGPVPPLLCKVDGLNGNGSGGQDLSSSDSTANDAIEGLLYKCSYIACPPGTASLLGRESLDGKTECLPCRNGEDDENFMNVIGLKDCSHYKPPPWVHLQSNEESMYEEYHNARIFGIALICIAMIVLALMFLNEVCKWYFSSDTTQQPKHTPLPMTTPTGTNDNEYDIDNDDDENYRGSTRTTTRGTRNSGMSSAVMTRCDHKRKDKRTFRLCFWIGTSQIFYIGFVNINIVF